MKQLYQQLIAGFLCFSILLLPFLLFLILNPQLFPLFFTFFSDKSFLHPSEITSFDELKNHMQIAFPMLMYRHVIPGGCVGLFDNERIWKQCFGSGGADAVVTTTTIFQVASISKTFAAAAVMNLVEDGLVALDDPVEKHLKSWTLKADAPWKTEDVTIRKLMSHTAGTNVHGFWGYRRDQVKQLPTTVEVLESHNVRVTEDPNANKFKYSGGGTTILQLLIEDVSGISFYQFLKQRVLEPLNMTSSTFEFQWWNETDQTSYSHAYSVYGTELPDYYYAEKAAAGLYSNLDDMMLFTMAFARNANHSALPLKHLMSVPMAPGGPNAYVGLGTFIKQFGERSTVGHGGDAPSGFKAQWEVVSGENKGIVVLVNGQQGSIMIKDVHCLFRIWSVKDDSVCNKNDTWYTLGILVYLATMAVLLLTSLCCCIPKINCLRLGFPSKQDVGYLVTAIRVLLMLSSTAAFIVLMVIIYSELLPWMIYGWPHYTVAYFMLEYTAPYFTLGYNTSFAAIAILALFVYRRRGSRDDDNSNNSNPEFKQLLDNSQSSSDANRAAAEEHEENLTM